MQTTTTERDRLYYAALRACNRLQTALVRAYGARAGDMRYRTDVDHPAPVRAARRAYRLASDAWMAFMERNR